MKIIERHENHKIIPTEKIKCDKCGSILEVTKDDFKKDTFNLFFFPITYDYLDCPVCNNRYYNFEENYWTRDLGYGKDFGE